MSSNKRGENMKIVKKATVKPIAYVTCEMKAGPFKQCILTPGPNGCKCDR